MLSQRCAASRTARADEITADPRARAIVVVAEVAGRDDPKGAYGSQRAAFRAAQCVLAESDIVDDLSVRSAREIKVTTEHVARVGVLVAITRVPSAFEPCRAHQFHIKFLREIAS